MFIYVIQVPHGLALDLEDDKLYWTDPEHEIIEMANLDGTEREIIVQTGGNSYPQGIVISPKRKYVCHLFIYSVCNIQMLLT